MHMDTERLKGIVLISNGGCQAGDEAKNRGMGEGMAGATRQTPPSGSHAFVFS